MVKDVFVQACGWGVFLGVGFMVMGSGCLCRRLVMARGGLTSGAPAKQKGDVTAGVWGRPAQRLQLWIAGGGGL